MKIHVLNYATITVYVTVLQELQFSLQRLTISYVSD